MTDHPTDDDLEAMGLDVPHWQAELARRAAQGDIHLVLPRENVLSFDRRVAASKPVQPYPSSVKVNGRWQDRNARPPRAVVDIEPEAIAASDRRIMAIVALVVAVMFAAGLLLLWIAPARDPHPCPLTFTAQQCKLLHAPSEFQHVTP